MDDFIDTVEELRTEERLQCPHRSFFVLLVYTAAKPYGATLSGTAGIGSHDNDGVFKVYLPAVGIGHLSIVQNLEQNIEHIGVGLLNLVKENNAVGLSADFFCQLTRLIIANIARRRSHQPGNRVLFHVFGHVQADQGIWRVKQIVGQLLYQLGLAYAGGADEDKGNRFVLGRDAHAVAADGGGHRLYRLILADNVGFQPFIQLGQPGELALLNAAGRDPGPLFNNIGKALGSQFRPGASGQIGDRLLQPQNLAAQHSLLFIPAIVLLGLQLILLLLQISQLILNLLLSLLIAVNAEGALCIGQRGIIDNFVVLLIQGCNFLTNASLFFFVFAVLHGPFCVCLRILNLQQFLFFFQICDFFFCLHPQGEIPVVEVYVGTGLVDQVDGLIRQVAVGDISL